MCGSARSLVKMGDAVAIEPHVEMSQKSACTGQPRIETDSLEEDCAAAVWYHSEI